MDVEVSDEMVDAYKNAYGEVIQRFLQHHNTRSTIELRNEATRAAIKAVIPLIASQAEAATIERCAKVAEEAAAKAVTNSRDVDVITQSVAAVDTAESIAAAIRSLSEGEKG